MSSNNIVVRIEQADDHLHSFCYSCKVLQYPSAELRRCSGIIDKFCLVCFCKSFVVFWIVTLGRNCSRALQVSRKLRAKEPFSTKKLNRSGSWTNSWCLNIDQNDNICFWNLVQINIVLASKFPLRENQQLCSHFGHELLSPHHRKSTSDWVLKLSCFERKLFSSNSHLCVLNSAQQDWHHVINSNACFVDILH